MIWYATLFILGLIAGGFSPAGDLSRVLGILEPITLTALIASLLVPFAGFASNEKWQRWCLQFAIVPLFGMYTIALWREMSVVGMLLFVCASAVHFSYWMSSLHSRNYRLHQFQLGFASTMPATTRLIACLNGSGRSHEADTIIKTILTGNRPELDEIDHPLAKPAREEQSKA